FNCVHHFDLGRFLAAAARVLQPGGRLFIYTRTPQQNARTIWGRYFPGFTEHEQRLHSQAAIRDAVRRTEGLTMVAAQTFQHPRTSTAERLGAQAQGRHYSTFSFYTPQELRAAIATFLARLPGPEVCWAGGPAAGYGRVLVNGTLSVKASLAGQLFRLHRQSAGVLRLFVPGRLVRRPLRGLGHAGPLEQRAPGPESKYAAAPAITAASAS